MIAFLAIILVVVVIGLKLFDRLTCGIYKSHNALYGKTVLITGGNGDIGREIAINLAKRGAKVILACRNIEDGLLLKDEIIEYSANRNVLVRKLDLSCLKSVQKFALDIATNEPKLDILIHNAAVLQYFKKAVNEEGIEMTMATNYYGPFLLTHLLVDLMKKSLSSRIIYFSSEFGYRLGKVDIRNLNPVNMVPLNVYYMSKCAIIMSSLEIARRLKDTNITVNCLHPGLTDSKLWKNVPFPLYIFLKPIKFFWKTPQEGAQTAIYLAASDQVEGVTGKYFLDCREWFLNSHVSDMNLAKNLYECTAKILKITEL